jgi:hypothetical protein
MNKKILVYTFYNPRHLTFKLVNSLSESRVDKYYLGKLDSLLNLVKAGNYAYVLGLGDYRQGSSKIRIETKFVNQYGRNKISATGNDAYPLTWNLTSVPGINYSEKPGNGPCNRSAYLISELIDKNSLSSKFAFVHIPGSYSFEVAQLTITNWLKEIS